MEAFIFAFEELPSEMKIKSEMKIIHFTLGGGSPSTEISLNFINFLLIL